MTKSDDALQGVGYAADGGHELVVAVDTEGDDAAVVEGDGAFACVEGEGLGGYLLVGA